MAKNFPYVLLIDDDCLLPPNFPLVTERLRGKVLCIGYSIKSVGPNRSKGTLCQQAQDVEYKLSGIQRAFAGKLGSATFPHGAISIWDRKLLIKTFQEHPGFSVSEDWFFGHVARQLGCRIQMCTSCFVETETPSAIFFSGGGARGGFGEMTIWKQRFFRWNFFFVNGMYYDMAYILKNWRLGWWEIGAKIFVFQEVYETLLYLLAPFVLPISFIVRPAFSAYLFAATLVLYFLNVIIFNYVHLRSRGEMVSVVCLLYYMPYKIILTFVNIASCYYSIYKYAKYFAKRHAKVVEDENAVAIVLKLEENETKSTAGSDEDEHGTAEKRPRHFSITAVGTTLDSALRSTQTDVLVDSLTEGVQVVDFAVSSSPRLHTSPEPLSNLSTPSPLSRSRPRSWLRRSPSPRRYPGSYFPQLERNASSQSGFQDASTSNPTRFSSHAKAQPYHRTPAQRLLNVRVSVYHNVKPSPNHDTREAQPYPRTRAQRLVTVRVSGRHNVKPGPSRDTREVQSNHRGSRYESIQQCTLASPRRLPRFIPLLLRLARTRFCLPYRKSRGIVSCDGVPIRTSVRILLWDTAAPRGTKIRSKNHPTTASPIFNRYFDQQPFPSSPQRAPRCRNTKRAASPDAEKSKPQICSLSLQEMAPLLLPLRIPLLRLPKGHLPGWVDRVSGSARVQPVGCRCCR